MYFCDPPYGKEPDALLGSVIMSTCCAICTLCIPHLEEMSAAT